MSRATAVLLLCVLLLTTLFSAAPSQIADAAITGHAYDPYVCLGIEFAGIYKDPVSAKLVICFDLKNQDIVDVEFDTAAVGYDLSTYKMTNYGKYAWAIYVDGSRFYSSDVYQTPVVKELTISSYQGHTVKLVAEYYNIYNTGGEFLDVAASIGSITVINESTVSVNYLITSTATGSSTDENYAVVLVGAAVYSLSNVYNITLENSVVDSSVTLSANTQVFPSTYKQVSSDAIISEASGEDNRFYMYKIYTGTSTTTWTLTAKGTVVINFNAKIWQPPAAESNNTTSTASSPSANPWTSSDAGLLGQLFSSLAMIFVPLAIGLILSMFFGAAGFFSVVPTVIFLARSGAVPMWIPVVLVLLMSLLIFYRERG